MPNSPAVSNLPATGMGMPCARSTRCTLVPRVPAHRLVTSRPLRPLASQPRAESKRPNSAPKAAKVPQGPRTAQAVAPAALVTETADVKTNSVQGSLLRLGLAGAILAQLTGPHFKTWLNADRWDPDRLVLQARRLWYYSTLLRAGSLAGLAEFDASQVEELRAAVGPAFQGLKKFWLPEVSGWLFSSPSTPEKWQPQAQVREFPFSAVAGMCMHGSVHCKVAMKAVKECSRIPTRTFQDPSDTM